MYTPSSELLSQKSRCPLLNLFCRALYQGADHDELEARAPRATAAYTRLGRPIRTRRAELEVREPKATAAYTRLGAPIRTRRAELGARTPRATAAYTRLGSPIRTRRAEPEDQGFKAQPTGAPIVDHQARAAKGTRKYNIDQSLQGINDVVAQANAASGRIAGLIQ